MLIQNMLSDDDWEDNAESGVTQGPEETLQREITKSKLLKVERLQLRDEIEKLKEENQHLLKENKALLGKLKALPPDKAADSHLVSECAEKSYSSQAYLIQLTRISMVLLFLMAAWLFNFLMTL